MQSKWLGRIGLTALVTGVVGSSSGMVGCAAERDPINRVQLNAIPKSFLVGADYTDAKDDPEFYARSMLIKVPYGESGADFLLFTNTHQLGLEDQVADPGRQARRSRLPSSASTGTDGQGSRTRRRPAPPTRPSRSRRTTASSSTSSGSRASSTSVAPTTRARVKSRTSSRRTTADRPWTQRDYVRVDFSKNLVTDGVRLRHAVAARRLQRQSTTRRSSSTSATRTTRTPRSSTSTRATSTSRTSCSRTRR